MPERAQPAQEPREGHEDAALATLRIRTRQAEATSDKLEDSKLDIDFGWQIRSYVLHPYRIVKDHRTKFEVGDIDKVLDGYLEPFLRGYLLAKRRGTAVAAENGDDLDV